jgi:Fe2+ or Zn2+ uptake regulation protein
MSNIGGHKSIGKYLIRKNIKPPHHRIKVLQYLTEHMNHLAADMFYRERMAEIPTLLKNYALFTLNLFAERGIITMLNLEENESRYDAEISLHAHFKCSHCSQIYDVFLEVTRLELAGLENFEVNESHIYFKGICPICVKNRDEQIN